jgi:GST-like protein
LIDLYTWPTSNGHKVHIMLEECGLGEQFAPEFLAFSPNNKTPAMIDRDGPGAREIRLFESGAVLIYLAEKTGRFLPDDPHVRYDVMQWLMSQMSTVGPMLGQTHFFYKYAPDHFDRNGLTIGINRYVGEANRIYNILDNRLGARE